MSHDDRAHITADLLIGHVFARDYSNYTEERLIMMKLLCYIENIDNRFTNYFNFINDIGASKFGGEELGQFDKLNLV